MVDEFRLALLLKLVDHVASRFVRYLAELQYNFLLLNASQALHAYSMFLAGIPFRRQLSLPCHSSSRPESTSF